MAIAIYSNVLDNGGISKFVYNMHHAFQKKNIKSEIVTFSADTIYGNNITLLSCTNHGNRIMKLRRFILDKDIDSIIANTWFEGLIAKLAAVFSRKKSKSNFCCSYRHNYGDFLK